MHKVPHRVVVDLQATSGNLGDPPSQSCLRLIACGPEQSPFELKDRLKKRGYRWSDGSDGRPRSWYVDVDEASQAAEIDFLRTEIYLREVDPRVQLMSAMNRFSSRL